MRAILLASLALAAGPCRGGGECAPVSDPGFENTIGANIFGPGNTIGGAWVVLSGTVEVVPTWQWVPAEGDNSLDLCGNEAGAVRQVIPTEAGLRYTLRFALAGNKGGAHDESNPAIKIVHVAIGDQSAEFAYDVTGSTPDSLQWVYRTLPFTPSGDSAALVFTSLTPGFYGPAIDDVSVCLAFCPGDVNGDNAVNFIDLNAIVSVYNAKAGDVLYIPSLDLDSDGIIGFADLNIVLSNFNAPCP